MLIHILIAVISFVCGGVVGAAVTSNNYFKIKKTKESLQKTIFDLRCTIADLTGSKPK